MGFIVRHLGGKAAVHGVEFGKMGVDWQIAASIDGDDFKLVAQAVFVNRAHHLAADAAIAIDGNLQAHVYTFREFQKTPRQTARADTK